MATVGVLYPTFTSSPLFVEDPILILKGSIEELVLEVDETAGTQQIGAPSALPESRVLVLYTGGTIGMKTTDGVYCPVPGYLPEVLRDIPPLNDRRYIEESYSNVAVRPYSLPPVRHMKKRVVYWIVEYEPLLDSCDMTFDDWIRIATDIKKAYHKYDGFVVLHGTDTLAYTASALSFMMENLGKPVIITGSQIPVAEVRSDGMENLIGALITAGNFDIPEVCVYFNNKLMRGNRTVKLDNSALEAFDSPNMSPLAQMAINIKVNYDSIFRSDMIAKCLRVSSSQEVQLLRDIILPPMFCNAAKTNDVEILKSLKAAGVNFSATDYNLRTALHVAASNGNIESVNYLLKIGTNVHIKDMFGYNALVCAVKAKAMDCVVAIRGAGGFIDASSQKIGVELCLAVYQNDIELLKCNEAAGTHMGEKDYDNRTALHVAASLNKPEIVTYLLQCGLNPYEKDDFGITPIDEARRRNLQSIVDLMENNYHPAPENGDGVFHME